MRFDALASCTRPRFPVYKTLEGFEFTSVKLPPSLSREELCSGAFIAEKKNLVLYGPVGTGKTHLASALGVLACSKGVRTRFFTAAELVVRLSEAFAAGTLEKLLKNLLRADLLIIDEWGYVPVDRQGAQLLFRIISDSYERRSVILTTNLEFSKWGAIFTDDQMAAAMIDRLAHHGYMLLFEGESYRMKHALMRQKGQAKIPTNLWGKLHDLSGDFRLTKYNRGGKKMWCVAELTPQYICTMEDVHDDRRRKGHD